MLLASGALALLATLAVTPVDANALVDQAQQRAADVQFRDAAKLLAQAREVRGNSHATLVRILALSGVVAASVGDKAAAVSAFRTLVLIEPGYQLPPDLSPKVRTPFYEARGWADERGKLELVELPAAVVDGQVQGLGFQLSNDALHLATSVRVHVAGLAEPLQVPLEGTEGTQARVAVPPMREARWWAEVLDAREAVLIALGTRKAPQVTSSGAPPPVSLVTPPPLEHPLADSVRSPAPVESSPPLRPLAYGLAAGGVVALGAGTYFGLQSRSIDSQLTGLTKNAQGQVTSMTERQAYSLNSQSATDAAVGNVLFAAGAAAAVVGVGLWIYGATDSSSSSAVAIAVTPGPSGLAISGLVP